MSYTVAGRVAAFALLMILIDVPRSAAEPATVEVAIPGAAGGEPVDAEQFHAWRLWLIDNGFVVDRCGIDAEHGILALPLEDDAQLDSLLDLGFTVIEHSKGPLEGGLRVDSQFFDPTEIANMLAQIASDHPAITRLFSVGMTYEGRIIYGIEISDQPGVIEDEPAIQFNGQHHAREVATSHVVMDVVNVLTDGYGVDPEVTGWVNSYKTVCVPMVNPDGVAYVFGTNDMWRKNRRFWSCFGVDLNRNYPYMWGPEGCGSSPTCSDLTYRGPEAESELETLAMHALADEWHFVMATSYHSYGQFIDYPYACYNGTPTYQMPEHAVIVEMMQGVRSGIIAAGGPAYTAYTSQSFGPLSGDDTSWYYAHKGAYAFIIEIGTSFHPPFSTVAGMVSYNRGGWKFMYRRLGQARIDVYVESGCSGEPLEAQVTLTNYVYDTGELARVTFPPFGRWTYMVRPNTSYTIRASAAGYVTQDVPVFVTTVPQPLTIALERATPPIFGDTDCDDDVDAIDSAQMIPCITGPGISAGGECKAFDAERDEDVDFVDFAAFQVAFTG